MLGIYKSIMKLIVKTEYERLSLVSPWLCLSLCSAATIDQVQPAVWLGEQHPATSLMTRAEPSAYFKHVSYHHLL